MYEWIYPLSSREGAHARLPRAPRFTPRASRLVCARDARFVALFSPRARASARRDAARRGTARLESAIGDRRSAINGGGSGAGRGRWMAGRRRGGSSGGFLSNFCCCKKCLFQN